MPDNAALIVLSPAVPKCATCAELHLPGFPQVLCRETLKRPRVALISPSGIALAMKTHNLLYCSLLVILSSTQLLGQAATRPADMLVEPFQIVGNVYFVGPEAEHSSYLIYHRGGPYPDQQWIRKTASDDPGKCRKTRVHI